MPRKHGVYVDESRTNCRSPRDGGRQENQDSRIEREETVTYHSLRVSLGGPADGSFKNLATGETETRTNGGNIQVINICV